MAKRILYKTNLSFAGETQNYILEVTPNMLKFKIVEQGTRTNTILDSTDSSNDIIEEVPYTETFISINLPLEILKQKNNLRSNTLFGVLLPPNVTQITQKQLVNYSELTKTLRLENCYASQIANTISQPYIFIFVKDINGTFEDHDIIMISDLKATLNNVDTDETVEVSTSFVHTTLLDTITVQEDTSYTNSDYYKFNVSTESYVDEVVLEQVRGITDRARVKLTSGEGSFRVLKSSLESGEDLRVKIGFASYPGITSITKSV
jgi:hypothetical protein